MRGAWVVLAGRWRAGGARAWGWAWASRRLVAGDAGAGAALLVLGPLLVGAPLGAGLGDLGGGGAGLAESLVVVVVGGVG